MLLRLNNMTSPILLTAASKINHPDKLSPSTLKKWYPEVHLPDVLAVPGVSAATFLEMINPQAYRPWFVVYEVDSVEVHESQAFNDIPLHCPDMFEGSIFDLADFEVKVWEAYGASSFASVDSHQAVIVLKYEEGQESKVAEDSQCIEATKSNQFEAGAGRGRWKKNGDLCG